MKGILLWCATLACGLNLVAESSWARQTPFLPEVLDLPKQYNPFLIFDGLTEKVELLNYFDFAIENDPATPEDMTIPPYDRKKHFGSWVNQDPSTCMNTRGTVLLRDTENPDTVTYTTPRRCTIATGSWNDPYTDANYKDGKQVQIDHVVPLKNAYLSGAYQWDFPKRCNYANFLKFNKHLLTVNASENMRKGDSGPDHYMPPNTKFHCEYMKIWLTVKAVWNLDLPATEKQSIEEQSHAQHCRDTTVDLEELARLKRASEQIIQGCRMRPILPIYEDAPAISHHPNLELSE